MVLCVSIFNYYIPVQKWSYEKNGARLFVFLIIVSQTIDGVMNKMVRALSCFSHGTPVYKRSYEQNGARSILFSLLYPSL